MSELKPGRLSECPHGVPHRWSCDKCDVGLEAGEPRLVSCAPDMQTCTLAVGENQFLFDRHTEAGEPVAWEVWQPLGKKTITYSEAEAVRCMARADLVVRPLAYADAAPAGMDFQWADKQLPAGVIRQDVCIWTQDSDGPWNTSCGVIWQFENDGPKENKAHFCHHCGGVLLAEPFDAAEGNP